MKKIYSLILSFFLFSLLFTAHVKADDYGPEGKRFGAGLYLGDPTGFTGKGYISEKLAFEGISAWSFVNDSFTLITNVTYDFFTLPVSSEKVSFPFYAGVGGKFAFNKKDRNNRRNSAGLLVPVGLAAHFTEYPIEIFIELAPGMEFAPQTEVDFSGGIGARFYFF
ncbi:MAG: hypothetical protein COX62_07980 [Deltaproteobacteria bacterium CG_4_10_14_0_2_um_filter_43_8]|nr:MAG: hypothetical protein COV43_03735 [Deltaproteobacteria bacterium CG11_big_fil_rev_8_21_14_0_20_42_23]PJA18842.1 MAG: hypothetical protein COX62_07980 [Deltaproteobacteria bacterium CG_4_10_14_0_2_um_filter_43_8]PJC64769.1 MAG: hypothetical protein CO021_02530 [Deltaproteobacteria bacterium CG_4_9_14_0_2_um_filter_42_21]